MSTLRKCIVWDLDNTLWDGVVLEGRVALRRPVAEAIRELDGRGIIHSEMPQQESGRMRGFQLWINLPAAEKMKAAGMIPVANGGIRWDDGMKFEIALAGINPDIYRRAIMQLDTDALKGKEVLAAFEQLRKLANWMNPNIAAQSWAVNLPAFVKGDMGMVLMGGWAQGNLMKAGATVADFSSGPAPQESGPPCFDLNADCFIFWKPKGADLEAGQKLFAEIVMQTSTQEMYSKITGSIPARTDVNLSAEGFSDGQRDSAKNLRDAIAQNRVVLSLGHNMAQPNGMTAAMIDVLTEYVHNSAIPAAEGQKKLVEAVASAQ